MKFILSIIIIIFVTVILFGVSIISFFLRAIFGNRRTASTLHSQQTNSNNKQHQQNYQQTSHRVNNAEESTSNHTSERKARKIFTKDDGEYVDFEEIKE